MPFVAVFVGTLFRGVLNGRVVLEVGPDAVRVRRPFPFPITRRISRPEVTEARLSAVLPPTNIAPARSMATPAEHPRIGEMRLDLVGERGLVLRLHLTQVEARWLAPRLRRALGQPALQRMEAL